MDEQREEQAELEQLDRDATDELREREAERHVWTDSDGLEWAQHIAVETERWSRV